MKMFFTAALLLTLGLSNGHSQGVTFSGTLMDSENGEPIQHALLYIDGTTFGVTSDENGEFEFENLSFPVRIEISHLSYEPKSILIENRRTNDLIYLNPRAIMLKEVLILNKNTRKQYIRKFNQWFIGHDSWGKKAKLLNDSALVFFDEEQGFRAGASEPLIIESSGLGYIIRAELKDFLITKNDTSISETGAYVATYHFTEHEKNKYRRNRIKAYFNSSEHFLKSLYQNSLLENGYEIKKETLNDSTNQKEYVTAFLDLSLVTEGENVKRIVGLKGQKYFILYYGKQNGLPFNLQRRHDELLTKRDERVEQFYNDFVVSTILFDSDDIVLRSDGTTPGSYIIFSNAIGKKKVGAMLPSNYQPANSISPKPLVDQQIPDRLIRKRNN